MTTLTLLPAGAAVTDVQLAGLRVTATTRAWTDHIDVCESVREYSVPCQVCWTLDRVADDAAYEYERQQHLARRSRFRIVES